MTAILSKAPMQAAESLRIMPLGDSITAGYTDNPDWNSPFHHGYRGRLYELLRDHGYNVQYVGDSPEPFDGRHGLPKNVPAPDLASLQQGGHRGYGGKDVEYVLAHIEEWLRQDNPNMVLLMIGTNNIYPETTSAQLAETEKHLAELARTIVRVSPDAYLIIAQIIPKAKYSPLIVRYNCFIRESLVPRLKAGGAKISTVDQYQNFLTNPHDLTTIDLARFSNQINHPDHVGYDRMAETWFHQIESRQDSASVPERRIGAVKRTRRTIHRLIDRLCLRRR